MHLLYHRHHRYTEEKHGHHEQQHQTCYNCGRQFMKYHGVLHRRRNQCPACHSEFEHSNAAEDAVETKQSSAGGTNIIMSRYFKSFTFHPSLKKTKLLLHESTAAIFTTRVSSFNDSTTEVREVEEGNDNHNMAYDGIEEAPCTDRESPCPYALTYETEEVESYQLSHESTNEEVESYQLEWLLYNNVHWTAREVVATIRYECT